MEGPDLLHMVWTGTARDAIGSLIMEMAEFAPLSQHETWDERLQAVAVDAREWCRRHKLAPSLIDDMSYSFKTITFKCKSIVKHAQNMIQMMMLTL